MREIAVRVGQALGQPGHDLVTCTLNVNACAGAHVHVGICTFATIGYT